MSRYLFLVVGEPDHYDTWDTSTDEEQQQVLDHFSAFAAAVRERGTLVAGETLDRPSAGFAVPRDRESRAVVDGPYAETAEQVSGFYLADLPDEAAARELALLLPPSYSVEVRHCPDVGVTPRRDGDG